MSIIMMEPKLLAAVVAAALVVGSCGAADHQADTDYVWDEGDSVAISIDDSGSAAGDDDTVTVDGSIVTITAGGTYAISGTLADGQLLVDSADDEVVRLVLAGADMTNSDGTALAVLDAEKVVIVLAEGTDNRLPMAPDMYSPTPLPMSPMRRSTAQPTSRLPATAPSQSKAITTTASAPRTAWSLPGAP